MTYQNSTWRQVFGGAKLALGAAVVAGIMAFSAPGHAVTSTTIIGFVGNPADPLDPWVDNFIGAGNEFSIGDLASMLVFTNDNLAGSSFLELTATQNLTGVSFTVQDPDSIFTGPTVAWNTASDGSGAGTSAAIPASGSVTLTTSFLATQTKYLILSWTGLSGAAGTLTANISAIPLPAGLVLFLSGLVGIGFLGRYKAKRREPAVV